MPSVIEVCRKAFEGKSGVNVEDIDDCQFEVTLDNDSDATHETYTVTFDDADVDDEEEGDGIALTGSEKYGKPHADVKVEGHYDILVVCVRALANSELASRITDLTTDGDNKDCEAIFHLASEEGDGYFSLKVR